MARWVYGAALFWTVFCTAVNCYTWRVAYPLWGFAGAGFAAVHREYMRRLDLVITVPHVAMFFSAAGLLWWRPAGLSLVSAGTVFGLETAVILVSAFGAGPVHGRLTSLGAVDEAGLRRLVGISAGRSVCMLVACGVLLWPLVRG